MPVGSSNPFPHVIITKQGSTPATPSTDQAKLFLNSSEQVSLVDDTGTARNLETIQRIVAADPSPLISGTWWLLSAGSGIYQLRFTPDGTNKYTIAEVTVES